MSKLFLLVGSLVLLMALVLACGEAAEPTAVPPTAAPTAAPEPTATPAPEPTATAMTEEEDTAASDVDSALMAAAEARAGGPGAFYLGDGDFSRLVGPAPAEGLGDANDQVNLAGLERESYLFDSDYYKDLIEVANFTNPTQMTYDGDPIEIQFACINRTVAPCELWANFFKPQVEARTNGKVLVPITSFPELGIAGPDSPGAGDQWHPVPGRKSPAATSPVTCPRPSWPSCTACIPTTRSSSK